MKTVTSKSLFILFLAIISLASECTKEGSLPNSELFVSFDIKPETGPINTIFTFDASQSTFYNHSKGTHENQVEKKWDFDYQGEYDISWDTEISTDDIVEHSYTEAKTYQVLLKLIAFDEKSNKMDAVLIKTVVVTEQPNNPPSAAFSFTPDMGNTLTDFSFDASGCTDEITPLQDLEVAWDFDNDGNWDDFYSTEKIVVHRFDSIGDYEVRMRVKDGDGNETELIKSLTVENCNEGGEPCQGAAFVVIDGEQYNTVQIGNQCWLNRNLNRGIMIESVNNQTEQTDNDIIEKFCYDNNNAFCEIYGGLYQWNEMMEYVSTEENQGICPDGWHIPTYAEWKELVDYFSDNQLASQKLKSCTDDWNFWYHFVNSNESGFTALPGGMRQYSSPFVFITEGGFFWSSSVGITPGYGKIVSIGYDYGLQMNDLESFHKNARSIRCIKD